MPDAVFETADATAEAIGNLVSCNSNLNGSLVYDLTLLDDTYIGHVEALPIDTGKWEIGYHVTMPHTGKGYATETVAAFALAIMRHLCIDALYGICDEENMASCRVLEKCGFFLEFSGIAACHGRHPCGGTPASGNKPGRMDMTPRLLTAAAVSHATFSNRRGSCLLCDKIPRNAYGSGIT